MTDHRLRAAAAILRKCATQEGVPSSPWMVRGDGITDSVDILATDPASGLPWDVVRDLPDDDVMGSPLADYIVMMQPALAEALADWLEDLADHDASDLMPMERGAFRVADIVSASWTQGKA